MITTNIRHVFIALMLFVSVAAHAQDGASDRGGGSNAGNVSYSLQQLIEDGYLKNSMISYVDTIDINQVSLPGVQATFQRITPNQNLRNDILNSKYTVSSTGCRADDDPQAAASTVVGAPNAEICFDLNRLTSAIGGLAMSEQLIRLAGLAFHEHVHHFQDPTQGSSFNEDEAYALAGYVLLTARTIQVPVLRWEPESSNPNNSSLNGMRCIGIGQPLTASDAPKVDQLIAQLAPFRGHRMMFCILIHSGKTFCDFGEAWDDEGGQFWLTDHAFEIQKYFEYDWSQVDDYALCTED